VRYGFFLLCHAFFLIFRVASRLLRPGLAFTLGSRLEEIPVRKKNCDHKCYYQREKLYETQKRNTKCGLELLQAASRPAVLAWVDLSAVRMAAYKLVLGWQSQQSAQQDIDVSCSSPGVVARSYFLVSCHAGRPRL
jgi:hypothetical protein